MRPPATCHPDRPHKAKGLCEPCYHRTTRPSRAGELRTWRRQNPDKVRDQRLRKTYGITNEDYETLLAAQGGVCAICRELPPADKRIFLCVDHDHETGAVRGILCTTCNRRLGYLDHPEWLIAALSYLVQAGSRPELESMLSPVGAPLGCPPDSNS